MNDLMTLKGKANLAALLLTVSLTAAQGQQPDSSVAGISGVNQDAVARVKPVEPHIPPVPNSSSTQGVNKVEGITTKDAVKAVEQTEPSPPPVASVTSAGGGSVGSGGSIRAVKGVTGINSPKMRNLEAALMIREGGGGTPVGTGAERGGKGKAAAAALLSAPLEKPTPKVGLKQDGRAGFQEFGKLQNRGS